MGDHDDTQTEKDNSYEGDIEEEEEFPLGQIGLMIGA